MPTEPEPTEWTLPDAQRTPPSVGELVGVGADLQPGTLLTAYRRGLFPMPLSAELRQEGDYAPIGWWSPDPRGVIPLDGLRITRSMRRSARNFEVRVDTAFDDVIRACADPSRPHGWIDDEIIDAYSQLFRLGWAHSVETWSLDDGTLAGGLYGVAVGGLFAGESMFHRKTDASKVALWGLVELLLEREFVVLDVQWCTDHLRSLGAIELPRATYVQLAAAAADEVAQPLGPIEQPLRLE